MKSNWIFLICILFTVSTTSLASVCSQYAPNLETLSGVLVKHVSNQQADKPLITENVNYQEYWILELADVRCMAGKSTSLNRPYGNISKVQLHLNLKQFELVKQLIGKTINVRGVLWQAHSRYHQTAIVMSVSELELLASQERNLVSK